MFGRFSPARAIAFGVDAVRSDTAVNMAGLIFAAALQLAVLPAVSRLFTPKEFGVFGGVYALAAFISTFAAGRYEIAIIGAESDQDARQSALLGSLLAGAVSLALAVAALLVGAVSPWPWHLSLAGSGIVGMAALFQVQINSAVRISEFRYISLARIAIAISQTLISILAGFFGWGATGLVSAVAAGQCVGAFILYMTTRRRFYGDFSDISTQDLVRTAIKYRRYPLMDAPATIANALATQLPTFFFISFYGATTTGYLTMLTRMWAGTGIISRGVGEVFRARSGDEYRATGQFIKSFGAALAPLALAGAAIAATLMLTGPALFAFVLGDQWKSSGEYALILAPSLSMQFVAATMSSSFYVSNHLAPLVAWQACLLVTQLAVLAFSTSVGGPRFALASLSISGVLLYSAYLYLSYREASRPAPSVH